MKKTTSVLVLVASLLFGVAHASDEIEMTEAGRKLARYRVVATWDDSAPIGRTVTLGYEAAGNGALTLTLSRAGYQLDRISDNGFTRQSAVPRKVSLRVDSTKANSLVLHQLQACREMFAQADPLDSITRLTIEFRARRRAVERAADLSLDTERVTIGSLSCSGEYMD